MPKNRAKARKVEARFIPDTETPRKIVYLLGAGATQADIDLKDDTIRILMQNIREGIVKEIDRRKIRSLAKVKNELVGEGRDVEHLITLYESTGIPEHESIARDLKLLFIEEIQKRINKLGINYKPRLLSALIDMHEIVGLGEVLQGVITLNYEDLLENAMQMVMGGVNYVISIKKRRNSLNLKPDSKPILKLHGSFNWKNDFPITLLDKKKIKTPEDVLWIPPGVEKKRERYPFNILWGRARELLDCDILRIIGCSLSRNDWQLISLLYTTQQLPAQQKEYIIELIDYAEVGDNLKNSYTYLSCRTIIEIKEVNEYIKNTFFPKHKREDDFTLAKSELLNNRKTNVFDLWLKAKGDDIKRRDIQIDTRTGIFADYINEVAR
ncbi:MAG: SIR2 family protein [Deltaproteobacteria bacterium]|nr:SIR2 family protein [Deltaproteobacteria bacterium]